MGTTTPPTTLVVIVAMGIIPGTAAIAGTDLAVATLIDMMVGSMRRARMGGVACLVRCWARMMRGIVIGISNTITITIIIRGQGLVSIRTTRILGAGVVMEMTLIEDSERDI